MEAKNTSADSNQPGLPNEASKAQLNEVIRNLSNASSDAIMSSAGRAPVGYNAGVSFDILRKNYLRALLEENPRAIFIKVAQKIVENMQGQLGEEKETSDNRNLYTIIHKDKQYALNQDVTIIGRHHSDVKFPSVDGCSRVHALIFPFPKAGNFGKIAVVDVGSLTGIITSSRGDGPKLKSVQHDRRALLFDMNETVQLEMGNQTVILSPGKAPEKVSEMN